MSLIEPISAEAPCGEYLKEVDKSAYRKLRNALNGARSAYRSLTETPDAQSNADLQDANGAAWQLLGDETEQALTQTTKDAEIFIWHIAAQIQLKNPLINCTDKINQLSALIDSHWDTLHPRPSTDKLKAEDEAGQTKELAEGILSVFSQLVGEVEGSGFLVPPLGDLEIFVDASYNNFLTHDRNGNLEVFREEMHTAVRGQEDALTNTLIELAELKKAVENCDSIINAKAKQVGVQGVSFKFVVQQLNRMLDAMRYILEPILIPWPLDAIEQPEETEDDGETTEGEETSKSDLVKQGRNQTGSYLNDRITSRKDAIFALEALARFFKETEPHSPIYMLLERAARWSQMPLPMIYSELLGEDSKSLDRIKLLTGLESEGTVKKAPMSALNEFLEGQTHTMSASDDGAPAPIQMATPQGNSQLPDSNQAEAVEQIEQSSQAVDNEQTNEESEKTNFSW